MEGKRGVSGIFYFTDSITGFLNISGSRRVQRIKNIVLESFLAKFWTKNYSKVYVIKVRCKYFLKILKLDEKKAKNVPTLVVMCAGSLRVPLATSYYSFKNIMTSGTFFF